MCGRFVQSSDPRDLTGRFEFSEGKIRLSDMRPRYNVAPSQRVSAVRLDGAGERELVSLTWGLLPSWAKEPKVGYSTINARAETVDEKPAFRMPFRMRRCLILADAFYEWKKEGSGKQPYWIGLASGEPFAFAGLWDRWHGDAQVIESCTIVVTGANRLLQAIHERMPVILTRDRYAEWLDPETTPDAAKKLLVPYAPQAMRYHPVSLRVNSPTNDDASLVEPLDLAG